MSLHVVGDDHAGQRLDVVVAEMLAVSRSRAAARIEAGEVTVDGVVATKRHRVRAGQQVEVADPVAPPAAEPPPVPPIRYQDEYLLVVAKPPGLVVHPGAGHAADTLVDALRGAGIALAPAGGDERPGIVHRLDRDTSGLLVVASTDEAHAGLVRQLADREVARRYVALVAGAPTERRGRIEAPVGRMQGSRTRFGVVSGGKPAVTRYAVLGEGTAPGDPPAPVSLVSCSLETGRTHQIRVHLTALGHPVIGDPVYGSRRSIAQALEVDRPLLHAAELRFTHPVTGVPVAVLEPVPADLAAACARAGIPVPAEFTADD
jgi:23S rRNA pseudouridine1911/1915/1917 synthase